MKLLNTLTTLGVLLHPALVWADGFPSETVTLVVPFGPGASSDIFAR